MFNFLKSAKVNTMSPAEADALQRAGQIVLVDVREPNEWAQMRVPGALHAPLSAFPSALNNVPADRRVVFYCLSGKRSARALEIAQSNGKAIDTHVAGGISAWRAAGLPVAG